MMAACSSIIAMIFMLFMDSILSNYLIKEMLVPDTRVGYFFALPCFIYSVSAPLIGYVVKFIPARLYLTQVAFLISFVALLMFGPSEVLGFPKSLIICTAGNCLDGFACSLIFVPLLSEIVEAVMEKEGLEEENEDLNDLASGFFNTAYAVGCLIAPILGGAFNDLWGFRFTCDIFAFSSLAYAAIYFFLNTLPYILSKRKTPKT